MTSYVPRHYLYLLGTPINIQTDSFEAKMSQGSIMQNIGYDGLVTELSQGTNTTNQQSLIAKDSKRTRRSQDKMTDVKKKKIEKIKQQKQFSSKGASLSKYRGQSNENDENKPPSADFLCTKTLNMSLKNK